MRRNSETPELLKSDKNITLLFDGEFETNLYDIIMANNFSDEVDPIPLEEIGKARHLGIGKSTYLGMVEVTRVIDLEKRQGEVGNNRHLTAIYKGYMDCDLAKYMRGKNNEHAKWTFERGSGGGTGRYGRKEWNDLLDDVQKRGIVDPVFIVVEWDGDDIIGRVYEGNHRIRVGCQLDMPIPVEIRFFGKSEDYIEDAELDVRRLLQYGLMKNLPKYHYEVTLTNSQYNLFKNTTAFDYASRSWFEKPPTKSGFGYILHINSGGLYSLKSELDKIIDDYYDFGEPPKTTNERREVRQFYKILKSLNDPVIVEDN